MTSEPWPLRPEISGVYDGDTFSITLYWGGGLVGSTLVDRVRLLDVDAYELVDENGVRVRDVVIAMMQANPYDILSSHKRDGFGRLLADVRFESGERLSRLLLEQGLAEPYRRKR